MKAALAIATPAIPLSHAGGDGAAVALLGNEWSGLALDFVVNHYAVRVRSNSELLLGSGPYSMLPGLALDFTDNSNAVGT